MMKQAVREAVVRAQTSGALHKLTATSRAQMYGDFPYLLLTLAPRVEKPQGLANQSQQPKMRNPFAQENLEADLVVRSVNGTHTLILNKFNVVDEHTVLVTNQFEEQSTPLVPSDFAALWKCIQDLNAFGFFNCGHNSGASQPHKHMQLITIESAVSYVNSPTDGLPWMQRALDHAGSFDRGSIFDVPWFQFRHGFVAHGTSELPDGESASDHLHTVATTLLQALDSPPSYNLILTKSLLLIVPRRERSTDGIEINSVGFTGSFLVRNDAQASRFTAEGPFEILAAVGFPKVHEMPRL
ncbi:hypothetical protein LEN26_005059 [Aphanomyces euteiches]|nr:hypothetical protein LEN26_005059 [Aphanomyces euteiches]KAH9183732.1 hypothetical protein AeNC1_014289 [Aphanomyces euteiches]